MLEQINTWIKWVENHKLGCFFVYVSIFAFIYALIWSLIEPLSIPDDINIFSYTISRPVLHTLISCITAPHLTMLLLLYVNYHRKVRKGSSIGFLNVSDADIPRNVDERNTVNIELQNLGDPKLIAKTNQTVSITDVMIVVSAARRRQVDPEQVKQIILIALNSHVIEQSSAVEILKEFKYDLIPLLDGGYKIISRNSSG